MPWHASAASRGASSSGARRTARRSSTTTRTCPARSRPRSRRRAAAAGVGFVCVFQPHRYSRIAVLGADFADAFVDADELVVTDIYGAGEAPRPGVSGRLIVDAVRVAHPEADVTYLPRRTEIVDHLRRTLRAGDCCLTLGAGDLTSLADDLLAGGED